MVGKGKGRRLDDINGGTEKDKSSQQEDSASRGRGGNAPAVDVAQGLDLGRVLGAFRVSASQLG
jgi:hypothetical protein